MTGDQSRKLKVGDRVCWHGTATDKGTVSEVDWTGVTIKWDTGIATLCAQRYGASRVGADEGLNGAVTVATAIPAPESLVMRRCFEIRRLAG